MRPRRWVPLGSDENTGGAVWEATVTGNVRGRLRPYNTADPEPTGVC